MPAESSIAESRSTRAIELTPPGRAAVAVVLVAGPDAVRMVDACFQPAGRRRLAESRINRILLGRWGGPDGEELIACRRADDEVEIHCHGGAAAIRNVIDRLSELGCEPTRWQDWLQQTEDDPIRAAARIALADAPTARTAAILLDQRAGALSTAIQTVLDSSAAGEWETAIAALAGVLAHCGVGLHLTAPWQVVLAGRPNVGKSSLLNALVGYQRAIVCELPGTTRDVVTTATAIDGWPIQLADTAGLRQSEDELEAAGVARAGMALANADLIVLVDEAASITAESKWTFEPPLNVPVLRVLNKIDLLSSPPQQPPDSDTIPTSAVTGAGIDRLAAEIGRRLVPVPPPAGAAVPFTDQQIRGLEAARAACRERDAIAVATCLRPLVVR